jgi:AcrR family transcriptional regulator
MLRAQNRFENEIQVNKSGDVFKIMQNSHIKKLIKMPAKNPRGIETKHHQIIDGACAVFCTKGFHPTTTREIAKACGMSMGQIYHYISSKDDVLFLIHKHLLTAWYQHLMNFQLEEIENLPERLSVALKLSFDFLAANKKLLQFVYTESKYLNKKHLRVVLKMDDKYIVGFWRELLRKAGEDQKVEIDLNLAANLIEFLMVFLPLKGWNFKRRPLKEVGEFLRGFIFGGLGLRYSR